MTRLLDESVVNENLVWLEDYPEALKGFEQALAIYLRKDATKYRNLLDNLRHALEQLLRSVLDNGRSLEKQKEDVGRWLKGHGAHKQIINMYQTLLAQFAQYQNTAVKHGEALSEEAFSESELEFMIYLTGTFMRFVLELDRQSSSSAPVP